MVNSTKGASSTKDSVDATLAESIAVDLRQTDCCQLSYKQRTAGFLMCLITGMVLMVLSMTFVGRILIGRPEKFMFSYALSNLFSIASITFLLGPTECGRRMCNVERAPASLATLITMILSLLAVWKMARLFILLPLLLLQFGSMLWWLSSFLPFGQGALLNMVRFTLRGGSSLISF